jgi:hypothetical protein
MEECTTTSTGCLNESIYPLNLPVHNAAPHGGVEDVSEVQPEQACRRLLPQQDQRRWVVQQLQVVLFERRSQSAGAAASPGGADGHRQGVPQVPRDQGGLRILQEQAYAGWAVHPLQGRVSHDR